MDASREHRSTRFRLAIKPGEERAAIYSFIIFFLILCSYYIIRPLRDQAAASLGPQLLPSVYVVVLVTSLAAVPLFGWLVNRIRISIVPTIVYFFFIGTGTFFALAFFMESNSKLIGYVFCVWVSMYSMYTTSIFWSLMSQAWREDQGGRLFPYISAGGTIGSLLGPFLVRVIMPLVGIPGLMASASAILFGAMLLSSRIQGGLESRGSGPPKKMGSVWSGASSVVRIPLLRDVAIGVFMSNAIMGVLYVEQARLVGEAISTTEQRVVFFSRIETYVGLGTIFVQSVVAPILLRRLGAGATAALVGLVALAGLIAVGSYNTLPVLVLAIASLRISTYGLWNPVMRVCYTTVSTEQKYKAQNLNDTLIYNGSPAVSTNLLQFLGMSALGIPTIALLGLPMALVWVAIGLALRRLLRAPPVAE